MVLLQDHLVLYLARPLPTLSPMQGGCLADIRILLKLMNTRNAHAPVFEEPLKLHLCYFTIVTSILLHSDRNARQTQTGLLVPEMGRQGYDALRADVLWMSTCQRRRCRSHECPPGRRRWTQHPCGR